MKGEGSGQELLVLPLEPFEYFQNIIILNCSFSQFHFTPTIDHDPCMSTHWRPPKHTHNPIPASWGPASDITSILVMNLYSTFSMYCTHSNMLYNLNLRWDQKSACNGGHYQPITIHQCEQGQMTTPGTILVSDSLLIRLDFCHSLKSGLHSSPRRDFFGGRPWAHFPEQQLVIEPIHSFIHKNLPCPQASLLRCARCAWSCGTDAAQQRLETRQHKIN